MPFIKPRTPPFATEEEAIEFFHKNGEYEFKKTIEKYSHSLFNWQIKLIVLFFPIYLILASTILFFDHKKINYFFYVILRAISIPVQHPYGWNVSYILSFLINLLLFIFIIKSYDFSVIKKVTRIKRKILIKFFIRLIFFILFMSLFILIIHIGTMSKKSTSCTLASYCFLQSDSMFLYSSLILYMGFSGIFMILTAFLYVRFIFNYLEINFIK